VTDKIGSKPIISFFVSRLSSLPMRLKSGALALLLLGMGGLAACHGNRPWHNRAASQAPNPLSNVNTCKISEEDAAGLSGDLSTDVHAARDYTGTIAHILKEEKFEELDCLSDQARSKKERFPGGMWKLHELYTGLYEPVQYPLHATQEDWESRLQQLQRWVTARPKSVTARVALAGAYIGYAGDARGNGYANTVSESGWKLFAQRTSEAKQLLQKTSRLHTKCPEWYLLMLLVAENQGWNAAEKRALFSKATKFEPDYYYYARAVASRRLPKWGGEPGAVEKFTQEVADRVGGERGDILYFQVATAPDLTCGCCNGDDPHLSLTRIERGFDASERRYGESALNLNRVAFLAARSRPDDQLFADKILTRIGEQWDEETWTREEDFETAKGLAATLGKRLAMEASADANMKTPEGLRYRAAFEKPYRELVRQCVQPSDGDAGKFKAFTNVGVKGTVEDVRIFWNSPAAMCVYEKLRELQQQQASPFPPPPQAPYWVRLDLDWADFAPVAAK
jgi:Domain of unknown function (DUF4034)